MRTPSRHAGRGPALALVIAAAVLLAPRAAGARSATLRLESREVHAGLPFVLSVEARGFEESPEPKVVPFEIPGAQVTFLGVSPSRSSMTTIVNGHRTEVRDVAFVFRYRVLIGSAGTVQVPDVTVEQGAVRERASGGTVRVVDVETTPEMQIRLGVPERPMWVGETFDVTLDWYLRRDVGDQTFVIPLFDHRGVEVEAPANVGRDALRFSAGAKELQLPFARSQETLDGAEYTRFRFTARATASQTGTIALPPASVVAKLEVGQGRDSFGFPSARTKLFKAEDRPRTLEIRPLPLQGRPASFANAVGKSYSIEVAADRTVVSVGEPVELRVRVRGDGRLEGMILPDLSADGGLAPDRFALPDEKPAGEILEGDEGKLFRVTVRLKDTEAREIPALAFSYFDPELGQYRTVRSQPIALSVKGSSVVRTDDVVRADRRPEDAAPAPAGQAPASLVGADLTLSREGATLRAPFSTRAARPFLLGLYGLPLVAFALQLWRVRTRGRREEVGEVARALRAVEEELERARVEPARDAAPRLARELARLARRLELEPGAGAELIQRLETESFDPEAASRPLRDDLAREARALAQGWVADARRRPRPPSASGPAAALVIAGLLAAGAARGDDPAASPRETLARARDRYQAALGEPDRVRRTAGFAEAAARLGEVAALYPDRPELLTDWGNAALGAQQLGVATLAYRRALHHDPSIARARRNLAWVRGQAPAWLAVPREGGALDSLFFWHRSLGAGHRHVLGAAAFGLALLLVAPLARSGGRRRLLRALAALPFLVWVAMIGSLLLERDASADAVVVGEAVTLRAADSAGAPPALDHPLPSGAEVRVEETRDDWVRVRLVDGLSGWVARSWIRPVLER